MLDRKMRKRIEWAFYHYDELKKQGAEYLLELAEQGVTAQYEGVGIHSSDVSNPTESKGIKVAGNTAAAWCKVVERTKERYQCDANKSELLRLKYKTGLKETKLCSELYLDRRTMYYWLDDMLTFATMIAIQEKVIKI